MAIEIKELRIQLHIDNGAASTAEGTPTSGGGCNDCSDESTKEEIVQDAVKEVLRILKDKQER